MRNQTLSGSRSNTLLWVLQMLAALIFVAAGVIKFWAPPAVHEVFARLGFGTWFRYLIGVLELGGGLLLVVPRFASLSAVMLAIVMIGAVATHIYIGLNPAWPMSCLALVSYIAWGRRSVP